MTHADQYLTASEAARRLGVSAKALRLYEQRGLLRPTRTESGWRTYGPDAMARAGEIAALRALGFSLAQIGRVLAGDPEGLEAALASHQSTLEARARQLSGMIQKVRSLRSDIVQGRPPSINELTRLSRHDSDVRIAFDLPWPWGGEQFELRDLRPLTWIVGPLGSGKTRFARRLAEVLPGAVFLGLDRLEDAGSAIRARLEPDSALKARVDRTLAWLVEDGAIASDALALLLAGLEDDEPAALVVDMIEQGLDQASQQALAAHLRRRGAKGPPVFAMTRSNAMLDLAEVTAEEAIILCPANHSPPSLVAAVPGAPGFEAVATCLAAPDVRARTDGVIAWRPQVA
ncbi:MerR family transcriptional regulator [Microbaculum marinum]|uniref:MerR family transcriptional regulator n=1 Tax=Microbaculum marinum TaxID=1764581 RepID=A0AAW9RBM0_9HYPH